MELNLNLNLDGSYSPEDIMEFLINCGWDEDQVANFMTGLVTYWAIQDAEWEKRKGRWVSFKDMKKIPREK